MEMLKLSRKGSVAYQRMPKWRLDWKRVSLTKL